MDKFPTLLDAQSVCIDAIYFNKCRLPEEVENIILMYCIENPRNIMFKAYFDRYGSATTATPSAPVKTPVKTPEKVEPSPFSPTLPQKLPEPKNG